MSTTEPATSAIFRALRSVNVDPELAYEAVEEARDMAGHNIIAELGSRIDRTETELGSRIDHTETELGARIDHTETELGARIDRSETELGSRIDRTETELGARIDRFQTELGARIDRFQTELGARIDALADRVDTLQKVLWPLVIAISVALLSAVGGGLFALFQG